MISSILALMGLGGQEMVFIFLALLLLFGAKKIPNLARGLGKGFNEFKDATQDVRETIEDGLIYFNPNETNLFPRSPCD